MSTKIKKIIKGTAIPIRGNEIDTDRIVPARFLKEITFEKMGEYLFHDVRYDEAGQQKEHPLNHPHYTGASIMVVENNFGCGSSREHAPQAILRYGIQALIGESFAEIFAGNCKALGIPTVTMPKEVIQALLDYIEAHPQREFELDIERMSLSYDSSDFPIFLSDERRQSFLTGTWDELSSLHANLSSVRDQSQKLPYFNNFSN